MTAALSEFPRASEESAMNEPEKTISVRVRSSEPHRLALAKIKGGNDIVLTLDEIGHVLTGEREPI